MAKILLRYFIVAGVICLSFLSLFSYAENFPDDNDAFYLKYLKQEKYELDTSAPAIVLYESSSLDLSRSVLSVRKIIKIIKKSGLEYADIAIPLAGSRSGYYFAGIGKVHGITYNLEGGKIKKQEIDEDNVTYQETGVIREKKIAMPAVREGSVIEYSYEIYGIRLSEWHIQEAIPKLYTRMRIAIPNEIKIETKDNIIPAFVEISEKKKNTPEDLLPYCYTYTEVTSGTEQSWVRKNVPAFDEEPFMPGVNNYKEILGISIKSEHINMDEYNDNVQEYIKMVHANFIDFALNSWDKINAGLLESFNFYRAISSASPIKVKARALAGADTSDLNIAKKIFRFVSDSITTSGNSLFVYKEIPKVLEERSGNSAEINFLLISLLRQANLNCRPVIVVTKEEGAHTAAATEIKKYNHTICQLKINGEKYYLDASEQYNPFGRLPADCYNGYARIIDRHDTGGVILDAATVQEKSLFALTTTSNSAKDYNLNCKFYFGESDAIKKRKEWNSDTQEIKLYLSQLIKDDGLDAKIKDYKVLNLNNPEKPLTVDFNIGMSWPEAQGGTIYINTCMIRFFETNPFAAPHRKYPIAFPARENLTYTFNLKLPAGYVLDDVPKSAVVSIDDKNQYKNMITTNKEDNSLTVYARLQLPDIFYSVADYSMLKEFFQKMGDAQQNTVVIKKQ